jgi:hypothetical protein
MTPRVLGCGLLAAAGFVLIAAFAIWRAGAPAECPGLLPYDPAAYEPMGTPMAEPVLEGVAELERAPNPVSFGLASWTVYLPPGTAPTASGVPLPPRIVLDCRDGTFQAFQRETQ